MRFSLKWILAVTAYIAIAAAAFSRPAWFYSDGLWSFSILCIVFATTLAVFARGRQKAAAIGFVLASVGLATFVLVCIVHGSYLTRVGFYPNYPTFIRVRSDAQSILRLRAGAAVFTLAFGLIGSVVGLLAFRAADCREAEPKMLRFLRIAVSVVSGLCCVLVIVLWVRSYSRFDDIGWAMSAAGNLYLSPDVEMHSTNSSAATRGATVEKYLSFDGKVATYAVSNVQVVPRPSSGPEIPYGVVAVTTLLFASLPWVPSLPRRSPSSSASSCTPREASRMKYRKLRIAWSVAWGLAAVLLVMLWARSYRYTVALPWWRNHNIQLTGGELRIDRHLVRTQWHLVDTVNFELDDGTGRWGVEGPTASRLGGMAVPFWALVGLAISTAGASWIGWSKRFSLRTLLIATTLVAVGLGVLVWLR